MQSVHKFEHGLSETSNQSEYTEINSNLIIENSSVSHPGKDVGDSGFDAQSCFVVWTPFAW